MASYKFPRPKGIEKVQQILAIGSGKGGVGKSTVTTLLAHGLKEQGLRVGLLDADIYGPSQMYLMGRPNPPAKETNGPMMPALVKDGIKYFSLQALEQGEKAAVLRAPMAVKYLQFFLNGVDWGELDLLLIDLPPGTGDIQLTLAQQLGLDGAVIVTTNNPLASDVAKKGLEMFQQLQVPILGLVENMSSVVCSHCDKPTELYEGDGAAKMAKTFDIPLLGSLSMHPKITALSEVGIWPTVQSISILKEQVKQLTNQVAERLNAVKNFNQEIIPNEVEIVSDSYLKLSWADKESFYKSFDLRTNCKCASCVDEVTGESKLDPSQVSQNIKLMAYNPVGKYGLGLQFSDGHRTGIYRFEDFKNDRYPETLDSPVDLAPSKEAEKSPEPTKTQSTSDNDKSNNKAPTVQTEFLEKVSKVVDKQINPALSQHGGRMNVINFDQGVLYVQFAGGCQGCSQVSVTIKNGVEKLLKSKFEEIDKIVDQTDHQTGENPYYT